MVIGILPTCMSVHHLHAWSLWRPEEDARYPANGVIDRSKPPCGFLELNPCSLDYMLNT